jgi:hypothetical protein
MAQAGSFGSNAPTTQVWDTAEIQNSNLSPETKELFVRLYQNLGLMSQVLATTDKGYYDTQQFLSGQNWFPDPAYYGATAYHKSQFRQPFRKVINMGALKDTDTTSQLHGITVTNTLRWTRIYGVATAPGAAHPALSGIPLPYVSTTGSIVELNVTPTTVNVITNDDKTAFTYCYVVLEYLLY